jgi:TPR repeat protein
MVLPLTPDCRAADTAATGSASATPVLPDEQVAALLDKLREQVAAGQTTAPPNDNAVETWLEITKLTAANLSPGAATALDDFVHTVRSAQKAEQASGHGTVALDLLVFADFAIAQLKNHPIDQVVAPPASSAAPQQPSPPEHGAPAEVRAADTTAQPPPRDGNTTTIPLILAAAPTSTAPPALTETAPQPAAAADPALMASYLERGDQMMAIKDISAARKFYEFAAHAGNAGGTAKLARTYDPDVLHRLGVVGLQPDVAKAIALYREAAALGDADAQERGRVLTQQAAR